MKTRLVTLVCAALIAFTHPAVTASADLDSTFGDGGKVTTAIGNIEDQGYSVAIQSDGKIVIAEHSRDGSNDALAGVRYNAEGRGLSCFCFLEVGNGQCEMRR